jgi:hypothetical protein
MSVPIWHTRCAMIFDEWARRYSLTPEEFSEILDEDGKPIEGYGERCATYFTKIAREMDAKNELPLP